jgi:NADH-quinone oxidoreductase subunit M
MTNYLLSLVLFLPLIGMLLLFLLPDGNARVIRLFANIATAVTFVVSLLLIPSFHTNTSGFQLVERASWIPSIGAQYLIGIDGISLVLILLSTLMSFVAVLCSWNSVPERAKLYYAMILLLETGIIGVFVSLDLFLFYIFWDVVLIPMYFIIGIFGGSRRSYAAIKFFLYTLLGSVFLLLGILALYFQYGQATGAYTFELAKLTQLTLPLHIEQWIFWAFFLGFAVKVPMVPFHTWLPDAHVEAPTAGSVLLASLMLKMGTYGFIRFSLPLLPKASASPAIVNTIGILSMIAIIYGALICLTQRDWKRLVAYSSVSHMGFCTLGIFALNSNGITGSVIQQISHGLTTGLLFLLVGFIYERRHTRDIADFGGLAQVMPMFATVFAITVFASAGLPLLSGFIGEFTILSGAFAVSHVWALIGVLGIILAAAYLLWLYQRTMLGPLKYTANHALLDLSLRERIIVAPLLILVFAIGIYPTPLFDLVRPAANSIVQHLHNADAAVTAIPIRGTLGR